MAVKSGKEKYNLDSDIAGKMLGNVFSACEAEPNKVSFDKIVSNSKLSFFTENLLITIASVLLLVTFFLPVFFPHNKALVSVNMDLVRELTVADSSMTENSFSISFYGDSLNTLDSYMEGIDGTKYSAIDYDREKNRITFPYTRGEYNIFIYDINGKVIHLLLSPHD